VEADLITSVPKGSERHQIMRYIWTRCEDAWAEDEVEEAQELHAMYVAFENMSDEDVKGVQRECKMQDV
jgi:hypothetical protein